MSDDRLYQRWDELSPLVDGAKDLKGQELDDYCSTACGDDKELQELLRRLLRNSIDTDQQVHHSISQMAKDASKEESLVGATVGAYTLVEELGVGGMGAVYLATRADGEFDKEVAVKVVREKLPGSMSAVMFRNERQALANLFHPSIPTLVDAGELEDGRPYFICDFIDGVAIDDYCNDHQLSTKGILNLFNKVAEAVQHAHTNLILHLDIKPKNILVQNDGTPSLLDFGVARVIGDQSKGSHAFSPSFASPEQIRGDRLTAASDVYSLGALLFSLLSGERPFTVDHRAPTKTVFAKRAEFIDRLKNDHHLKSVDIDLRAIVHKAMSERPADRYATVDSLLSDLRRYRAVLPVKARKSTPTYRLGKFTRRHKIPLALSALALVALAGFTLREVDLRKQAQEASVQAQASAKAAEEALVEAAREAETSLQVSDFSVKIFEVLDPSQTRGNSVTARELLDTAAQRIDVDLATQPEVAAKIKHTIGSAYSGLGLYEASLPVLEQARVLNNATSNVMSLEHAALLNSLGKQYDAVARHEDAVNAFSESLAIKKEILGAEHAEVVVNLVALARLNRLLSFNDKAEALLMEATDIIKLTVGVDDLLYAAVLHELSRVYGGDRRDLAFQTAEQAVTIRRANDADPLELAQSLDALGDQYRYRGEYAEALEKTTEALKLSADVLPPDHPTVGSFHWSIGLTNMYLKNFAVAEEKMLIALEIQKKGLGDVHPSIGFTNSVLGEIYQEQGEYAKAEAPMKRALEIMRVAHPEEHPNVSFEKFMLAGLYQKMGRLDEALSMIDDSVKHYTPIDPATNFTVIDARWTRASILHDRGQSDEAAALYAELFRICERIDEIQENDIVRIAESYATFLNSRGEQVNADDLMARLRVN